MSYVAGASRTKAGVQMVKEELAARLREAWD